MLKKTRKSERETDAAFALAVLLQNVLILIVIGGFAWMMRLMMSQSDSFNVLLRGGLFQ
jgi:hypothetical protein